MNDTAEPPQVQPEDLWPDEWVEWFHMTPQERWRESEKLWAVYLALGGSLDPEPDTQSPFYDPEEAVAVENPAAMRIFRRSV